MFATRPGPAGTDDDNDDEAIRLSGRWDPDLFGVATQFSGVDGFVFFISYLDH